MNFTHRWLDRCINQFKDTPLKYDYEQIFDGVYSPVTEYTPLPMTEQLFWNRVGWLQQAMIRAENFEFRLLWFNKLQELMKLQP